MKPFKTIAIAALAAGVAGTALTAGLSASAQDGAANGDGGQHIQRMPGVQFAQMGAHGGHGSGFGQRGGRHAERLFERFDVNEDGVITEAELEEVRTTEFAEKDNDGNGEISLEEFKAEFLNRSNSRMVRTFQFLDRDGDGTVTTVEADFAANRMFNMLDRDENGVVERMRGPRAMMGRGGGDDERGPRGMMGQRNDDDDDDRDPRGGQRGRQHAERDHHEGQGRHGMRHGGGGHGSGGHGQMFLRMFDTDGDGKVTREEFDTRRGELFALADTNGSGSFTLEEFGPLWLEINEDRIVHMFQRADADGSLGITTEEAARHQDRMMEQMDRNKDGVITKADFKHGKRGWKHKGMGRHHRG